MAKKLDPTLKAVLIGATIAVAPFLGMAYYAGAQAAAFTPKGAIEPGGFRWRGLSAPAKVTKVAEMPESDCVVYRVDTEGSKLYIVRGNYQNCSITSTNAQDDN
ncbi:hypothetical protein HOU03_gp252 [Caulobacter phage CcrSC]|uniref:Uncharacterized protein n=1 Tax=Caulobacter phage CcrSC TaxID=2283272 RepID=A0A385EEC2_9CAUD|nr:hypothetical protein HOU03_gp252 [Caulobacter phage CcrSC]AXQ70016.1 hypothetical protein CcrSC_gp434 [Caulobacter phage CcrSC]